MRRSMRKGKAVIWSSGELIPSLVLDDVSLVDDQVVLQTVWR